MKVLVSDILYLLYVLRLSKEDTRCDILVLFYDKNMCRWM